MHFTVKIGRRLNYNIDLIKLRINKITVETTKRLLMKNLPTLRNDSSFSVQFSYSVLKTRAILLFTIKIIEIENTSWKVLAYGIYARVVDVSEIERVSAANE